MPRQNQAIVAFNRGLTSRYGLARVDLERTALAAEEMTNWMPRVMGAMSLRVGNQYIGNTLSNAQAKIVQLKFGEDDDAELELTATAMRVRIDDTLVTRPEVATTVTNGTFTTDLSGWTDNDESGAASTWASGAAALLGDGTNAAILDQQVTVGGNSINIEHGLRIVVTRGPIILRVGTQGGFDDYIGETTLGTGTHSLAFTPTGNFWIRIMGRRSFTALVDSVTIESAGAMQITTPWGVSDFPKLRMAQSGDVVYVACHEFQQRKIERRSARSWSVVLYEPEDGPFRSFNSSPIELAPSALSGDINIASSKAFFRSTHVGALFKIESSGQTVSESISAQNTFSDPIRVTGVDGQRAFGITLTGTWVATVTLQYSVGEPGNWVDVATYTTTGSTNYNDDLDNQIIYYRIGVKTGQYTSGTVEASLIFSSGSITGIARITGYTSETQVSAIVLQDFGATEASADWKEGAWSDRRGWPTALALCESRLAHGGIDSIWMSIIDQYESFDEDFEGDAGAISRTIGEGPIELVTWMLALTRLMVGTLTSSANIAALKLNGDNPLSARASSFDEPLTPTNFQLKTASAAGMFVDASGQRLMSLNYDVNESDYVSEDLTVGVPDLNEIGIAGIAIQYKPDVRVWCWRTDGTASVMVRDRGEGVICWLEYEVAADGIIEDISVKRGDAEDRVYFVVRRTVDGATVRFIEKTALETECRGNPEALLADAFIEYSGAETTTITGLSHLEGETVVCWGWNTTNPFTDDLGNTVGRDFGEFTVSGGQITGLSASVTNACVGLGYTARYKSAKQAFAAAMGTPLNQKSRIDHIGLVLADTHAFGLRIGKDFDHLYDMPNQERGGTVDEHRVYEDYDEAMHPFEGSWTTDSRVCMEAASPRPATVMALTVSMQKNG